MQFYHMVKNARKWPLKAIRAVLFFGHGLVLPFCFGRFSSIGGALWAV
jgi:hypothetical protein